MPGTAARATHFLFSITLATILAAISIATSFKLAYAIVGVAEDSSALPPLDPLVEFGEQPQSSSYILAAIGSVFVLFTVLARTSMNVQ